MNLLTKFISKAYLILIIFSFGLTFCSSPVESDTLSAAEDLEKILETMTVGDLSPAEKEGLLFMRGEEKLARDVYINLYEKWDMTVFNNISKSEQRHTESVKLLLERYGLEDPMEKDEFGVFQNESLQNLYNTLVESGHLSIEDALKVGGAIEEIDILDLELQINEIVDSEDIKLVYNNLLKGSRNHLRTYTKNLSNIGVIYEPQYMTEDAYQVIIDSDMERGGNGKGNRRC